MTTGETRELVPQNGGDEATAYIFDLTGVSEQVFRQYNLPIERSKLQGNQGLINPPVDLTTLAAFYNESTWHRKAVSVKARDVVGHDWVLVPEFDE